MKENGMSQIAISGRTQMLSQYSLSQSLVVLKELGFDGVEISMLSKKFEFRPDLLEDYLIEYNKHLMSELGLKVTAVSYHGDFIYDDHVFENIKKTIRKVNLYGTKTMIYSGTSKKTSDKEEWNRMIQRTKEMAAIAEQHGVILAQEFEPGFVVGNTNELLNLFEDVQSEHLACNLDIGHVFLCDIDPMKSIRVLGKKVVHVHIENMLRGVHNHLIPQLGDMDLSSYIAVLKEIGFTGGMALDIYSYDYAQVAPEAIKFLKELI